MFLFLTINLSNVEDKTGLAEYYRRVLPELKKRGAPISIFNINIDKQRRQEISNTHYKGIPMFSMTAHRLMDLAHPGLPPDVNIIHGMTKSLNEMRPHAVVCPDYLLFPYLDLAAVRRTGTKVVFFTHLLYRGMMNGYVEQTSIDDVDINPLATASRLELIAISQSDEIWANSHFTANELQRYYGHHVKGPIKAAPLGVDVSDWNYAPQIHTKSWGFFGRLDTQKGLHHLFNDMQRNAEAYRKNPLNVAGRGRLEGEVLRLQEFERTLIYRGGLAVDEIKEFLKPLKWVAFPSVYEPWGQVVSEALAMGKICVVQAGPSGMTEQVKDGVNGFHLDFERLSFAQFVRYLESSDVDFASVAECGRKSARHISEHVDAIEGFINGLAARVGRTRTSAWAP